MKSLKLPVKRNVNPGKTFFIMDLCIDIGNTEVKSALFRGEDITGRSRWTVTEVEEINRIKSDWPGIQNVIMCSVRAGTGYMERQLRENFPFVLVMDDDTAVPVKNLYLSRKTLGKDRLAAIAGAHNKYPGRNVLVVDAGTAVTFDVLDENGRYLGGNISPGINMRFKALNELTDRLPLVSPRHETGLIARNTEDAIAWGVMNGVLFEIESYIRIISEQFSDPIIIFTGGDAGYFDKKVKSTIFVDPDLIFTGLNAILKYNVNKK